jgi:hypothetical protein
MLSSSNSILLHVRTLTIKIWISKEITTVISVHFESCQYLPWQYLFPRNIYQTHQPIHCCSSDKTWIHPHTSDILHQCQVYYPLLHHDDYILRRRKHLRTRYATCESQLYGKCSSITSSNRFLSTWMVELINFMKHHK